ncbi:MAG: hypothetical protein CMI27_03810 [Opitutae bacterium]|nr:hypothetical protein [Opitutae bacterium]
MQSACNNLLLYALNFLFQSFSLSAVGLLGLLSTASVCPDLHSSLFHGSSGCSHSHGLCGSHGDSDENDDSQSCPVVLYGQGLESPGYFITPMVSCSFFQEPNSSFIDLQWSSRKNDSFGARDPPHRA